MTSDRSTWSVAVLADFLDERQKSNEALIVARYEADQQALQATLKATDRRLDEIQGFRGAMSDQAARKVDRAEFLAEMRAIRAHMDATLAPIEKEIASHGKPNWGLFVSLGSVVLGVIAGCWLLIGLEISVAMTPLAISIEQNKADSAAVLRRVADLENRMTKLENETGSNEARVAEKLTEIETQFALADHVRNMNQSNEWRWLSILWHDAHPNETLPTDNSYFPSISKRGDPVR